MKPNPLKLLITWCLFWTCFGAVAFAQTNWIDRAIQARKAGNLPKAAEYLLKAHEATPDPVLLNNLGKVYEEMGRYDLAYATYKRVVDDPNASAKLRALDEERMNRIVSKLSQTMVLVPNAATWKNVWVNGKAYPMGSEIELSVAPGELQIDLFEPKSTVLIRMNLDGSAGRRLVLKPSLTENLDKRFGVISWDRATRKLRAISVDDVPVRSSLKKTKGVQIAPGTYTVVSQWVGRPEHSREIVVKAGQRIEIAPHETPPQATGAIPLSKTPPKSNEDALDLAKAPPQPAEQFNWLVAGQITTALVGMGLSAFGYAQYNEGTQERNEVRDFQNSIESPRSMQEYEAWDQDNARATDKRYAGAMLTGLGGVTIVAGAMWWLLTDAHTPNQTAQHKQRDTALVGRVFW